MQQCFVNYDTFVINTNYHTLTRKYVHFAYVLLLLLSTTMLFVERISCIRLELA